jgi:hypothetical protein
MGECGKGSMGGEGRGGRGRSTSRVNQLAGLVDLAYRNHPGCFRGFKGRYLSASTTNAGDALISSAKRYMTLLSK